MDFLASPSHGYLIIGGLTLIGAGFLIISLVVNAHVAHSVRDDLRHREKLLEYYRNTFSQLGVILIGIGVSLFIFFVQQSYQDESKRNAELQQTLAKMALRIGRAAPLFESLQEVDALLDRGGPYVDPADGGANGAVTAQGPDLVRQVGEELLVERDIDVAGFDVLNFSRDLDSSIIINELDPVLWLNIARDESEMRYAMTQLALDYKDLHAIIGNEPVQTALNNDAKQQAMKREMLDILYDANLLRYRARRLLGRACWLVTKDHDFINARAVPEVEADYKSNKEWLDHAEHVYDAPIVTGDCFSLLRYRRNSS